MEHAEFCSLVEETTGLHIHDLIFRVFYKKRRTPVLPLMTRLATLNLGVDDVTSLFERAYAIELSLGLKDRWKERAQSHINIDKYPDWVDDVSLILNNMLVNTSFVDAAFDLLMRGNNPSVNFKGMLYGFGHKDTLKNQRDVCLCRDRQGQLRHPAAFLLFPRNQTMARMFCDSAMAADDLEAVQHLLSVPQIAKHLPQDFLAEHVKVVNNQLLSSGQRTQDLALISAFTSISLQDYAQLLIDSPLLEGKGRNKHTKQSMDNVFNEAMLRKAPDEFVHLLMTTSRFDTEPVNAFISRMHRVGLPTAKGFLMANFGRFYMLEHPGFSLTEPEIVNLCFSNNHRRGYLGILTTLSPEIIAGHPRKDLLLEEAYKLTGDQAFVLPMSLQQQAKSFSGDLGL